MSGPSDSRELAAEVGHLLADPALADNPLRPALARLYDSWQQQQHRIDRLARISDSYQALARDAHAELTESFRRELRKLGKLARISDGYQSMMREQNVALVEASTHDSLTRLGNRRLLLEQLHIERERSVRLGHPVHVAVLDIDHFKQVNDQHGHAVGDRLLVAVAQAIRDAVREYDHCGRWGGEEFLLVLPQAGVDEARRIVERVREAAARVQIDGDIAVTLSAGIAGLRADEPIERTVARADQALYAAKRQGRNRTIVIADDD